MDIEVISGDITKVDVEAIVNPANSFGLMGGGIAGAIKRAGGIEIQEEAITRAPTEIGKAILTTAGTLSFKGIIHAPTMRKPAEKTIIENVKLSTEAALRCAEEHAFESIAMPGFGTGVGGIDKMDATRMMVAVIKAFKGRFLKKVILVGINQPMVDAFLQCVEKI
ncbi:O-acetyl-ADP-ribose deacetylase [Candidatus Woesearchaeota archaeon CG11_big_fil_rev_8_21_14_0_20_43_8]|nr:MAG: O-acetyl-ADP-ribose deacetylase [Candidatus Woesearchaeota archaeon CG11_big_fil_rev_8_21_14_0_20_43_8]PIO05106.1 MAG: O-acetyl-ADP-ribose deacetylase [Candidatus Woesearchaeota archaeon CG08_land_8_20_14_0_20_43_7]